MKKPSGLKIINIKVGKFKIHNEALVTEAKLRPMCERNRPAFFKQTEVNSSMCGSQPSAMAIVQWQQAEKTKDAAVFYRRAVVIPWLDSDYYAVQDALRADGKVFLLSNSNIASGTRAQGGMKT